MNPDVAPLVIVDAFAHGPFTGNPAAVCLLDAEAPEAWMQALGGEMNLSETAFVRRAGDAFALRWFTPTVEVSLCGHATLATAHVLWEAGWLGEGDDARFDTRSGRLVARRRGDRIEIDLPARPVAETAAPAEVIAALGAEPRFCGATRPRRGDDRDLLLELDSAAAVRSLAPDFRRLRGHRLGCIVTARGDGGGCDFVSRYFAPAWGIDEDPVTGAAHCALAPYWSGRLGRPELSGYQASARGGIVGTRLAGDRVFLTGRAVTVLRGALTPASAPDSEAARRPSDRAIEGACA